MRTVFVSLSLLVAAACYDGPPMQTATPLAVGPVEPTTPVAVTPVSANPPAVKNTAALHDPKAATARAPERFTVDFHTSKGTFTIDVHRAWAPNGADRFYNLVIAGYFDGVRFFRAIEDFMVQFGIHGDPEVNTAWRNANIPDDPVIESNTKGKVTFAQSSAPGSRTTQVFINYRNNSNLDRMRFAPFGEVTEGMAVVEALNTKYGEGAPGGHGPNQMRIQSEGNAYLEREFPDLDYVQFAATQ